MEGMPRKTFGLARLACCLIKQFNFQTRDNSNIRLTSLVTIHNATCLEVIADSDIVRRLRCGPSISISVVACLYVRGGAIESSRCKLLVSEFVLLDDWALSESSGLASGLPLGILYLILPYY